MAKSITFDEAVSAMNTSGETVGSTDWSSVSNSATCGYPYLYYHTYYGCACSSDKTGKAMSILKVLMTNDLVKVKSIKQFVTLLEKISSLL
jgi:hypothetical protein